MRPLVAICIGGLLGSCASLEPNERQNPIEGLEGPHAASAYDDILGRLRQPSLLSLQRAGYDDAIRFTILSTLYNAEGSWSGRFQRRGHVVEFVSSTRKFEVPFEEREAVRLVRPRAYLSLKRALERAGFWTEREWGMPHFGHHGITCWVEVLDPRGHRLISRDFTFVGGRTSLAELEQVDELEEICAALHASLTPSLRRRWR